MPNYSGVNVDHPAIVSTIKNMVKDGKPIQEIMKITGMPSEVVQKHQRQSDDDSRMKVKKKGGRPPGSKNRAKTD